MQTIHISIGEVARAAFFSHYVNGLSNTYDVLDRIAKQSSLDHHLEASVNAASLAFFYFQQHSTRAAQSAQEHYLSALPLVNRALGSADLMTRDSTLLAVLLLDLFEKIMNNNPRSSNSWMSHVKGALALVKMRDMHQFQTYVGLRLSVRLFTNMLISCVAANAPIPPALTKLRQDIEFFLKPSDPKWQVSGLVMEYTNLRSAIEHGRLSTSEVIVQAHALDNEFQMLAQNLPPSWLHRRVPVAKGSAWILEQYYDVYPDYFTAQTCNVIRIMRILLNDTIRSAYIGMASTDDDQLSNRSVASANQIINTMAREICAAGPQFTGVECGRHRIDEFSPVRRLHCYTLLFPFYVAGLYASPESMITEWVVCQLRLIADTSGIKNANVVADMLSTSERPPPWAVYAVLGSYAFAA